MKGVTDEQDTDCSTFLGWDDLENIEGNDTDKHHGENQERPGGSEGPEIMGFVEPDHEHGEADEESKGDVDPEEVINERRMNETPRNGCLVVSGEDQS